MVPEKPERSNMAPSVLIITLDRPDTPLTSSMLLRLFNKQELSYLPLFDADVLDSLLVRCESDFYQVSTESAQNLGYLTPAYLEHDWYLSVALAYKVGCQASFEEMTKLWESTLCIAAGMQQQPLPVPVLVVGFGDSQESSRATQTSADPDANQVDGEMFARSHGYLYAVVDSRTGQGTRETFTRVAEAIHAIRRVRFGFAGDSEGWRLYCDQARATCWELMRACR